jgi:hypothetical protein
MYVRDSDGDGCDDCTSSSYDPKNDGTDFDGDGICDLGDDDDDNDNLKDIEDIDDNNPDVCSDSDGDGCDDCTSNSYDPKNDGTDFDGDGICDLGDDDDDNDNLKDVEDIDDNNPDVCGDSDGDGCDDCTSSSYDPKNDGTDFDGDGICDFGDNCYEKSNVDQMDTDGDHVGDACEIPGCLDVLSNACNIKLNATDGATCIYPEENADCKGSCLEGYISVDGVCVADVGCKDDQFIEYDATASNHDNDLCRMLKIEGCMDSGQPGFDFDFDGLAAYNYDPDANMDDESCFPKVFGCLDNKEADNFNDYDRDGVKNEKTGNIKIDVNIDDGSCVILGCRNDNFSNYNSNATHDGLCLNDSGDVFGCMKSEACNYNSKATKSNASCNYAKEGSCESCSLDTNGNPLIDGMGIVLSNDADRNGVCDKDESVCDSGEQDLSRIDTDGDNIPDCVDPDDDNDNIIDETDGCDPESDDAFVYVEWKSNSDDDYDTDGCRDKDEDDDDDNDGRLDLGTDGVADNVDGTGVQDDDKCARGALSWTSIVDSDYDRDGCQDDEEDSDDDNDGVNDTDDNGEELDKCSKGDLGWTSISIATEGVVTDHDGDGCKDYGTTTNEQGEDLDDDNDKYSDEDEEKCGSNPSDKLSTPPDTDGDKSPDCVDGDDDQDGVLNENDDCRAGELNWTSSTISAEEGVPATDNDSDGCKDYGTTTDEQGEDKDDDNDGYSDEVELGCADTNPLDASSTPEDFDNDKIPDCDDPDDDNDGINDVDVHGEKLDECAQGQIDWDSDNPANDYDGDGCKDDTDEDTDDDNDGVKDTDDACTPHRGTAAPNYIKWTSNSDPDKGPVNDFDGDGCKDYGTTTTTEQGEDDDDDNDGVDDVLDACTPHNGATAANYVKWISSPIPNSAGITTDHDSDGCQDATEDDDDDNDGHLDLGVDGVANSDDDQCARGALNWRPNSDPEKGPVTDYDGDGCLDSSDCKQ